MKDRTDNKTAHAPGIVVADACYTLAELQGRLQLGRHAWRTARAEGLPVRTVGRRRYALGRDVIAWIERQPLDLATAA